MFLYRKPSPETLEKIIASQANLDFTYADVGATAGQPPEGFAVDRTRAFLGHGPETFEAAKDSLRHWRHYAFSWLEAWPAETPLEPAASMCSVARALGVWWVNVCRIVYVIDEPARFGFAYGTLPEHAECGEERFLLELTDEGKVSYEIFAFSRPRQLLARVGNPYVRRLQKRFREDSVLAMQNDVRRQLEAISPPA